MTAPTTTEAWLVRSPAELHAVAAALRDRQPADGWEDRAACKTVDPEAFFPVGREDSQVVMDAYAVTRRICAGCAVRVDCLVSALHRRLSDGMWGGLTPLERERLIRGAGGGSRG